MKKIIYSHKGNKLEPLTPEVAMSLDKGDLLRYIGPASTGWNTVYGHWRRRNFELNKRPKVKGTNLVFDYWSQTFKCPLDHVALVERGDPHAKPMRHAERLIPINLKSFKNNIAYIVKRTQENIDQYLDELPLHKKLELFKKLTPEDKVIYDCLYKDIEVLIGLKEEASSGGEQTDVA